MKDTKKLFDTIQKPQIGAVAATGGSSTNLSFSGDMARELFASMLTNTTTVRMGATVKTAGNLSCVKDQAKVVK